MDDLHHVCLTTQEVTALTELITKGVPCFNVNAEDRSTYVRLYNIFKAELEQVEVSGSL